MPRFFKPKGRKKKFSVNEVLSFLRGVGRCFEVVSSRLTIIKIVLKDTFFTFWFGMLHDP